jgi:hypothetical protein
MTATAMMTPYQWKTKGPMLPKTGSMLIVIRHDTPPTQDRGTGLNTAGKAGYDVVEHLLHGAPIVGGTAHGQEEQVVMRRLCATTHMGTTPPGSSRA